MKNTHLHIYKQAHNNTYNIIIIIIINNNNNNNSTQVVLTYRFPLSEVASTFYNQLKSVSKGYASFDYTGIQKKN